MNMMTGRSGLLTGLLLGGLHATTLAQAPTPAPAPVVIDIVRSDAVDTVQSATGAVASRQEMSIRAPLQGRLEWIREIGERVSAGGELARIDVVPLKLQLEERKARIDRTRVQLANLELRLSRFSELEASDYTTVMELDDLRAQRDLARGDLAIAQAQVRQLEDRIRRGRILAPFDGLVSQQHRHAGEELNQGDLLGRLLSTTRLEVRAQLPLAWLKRLKPGDVLETQALGVSLLGRIRHLIADADTRAQTFEARIDLPADAAEHWAPGQLADVRMPTALLARSLLVPRDALVLRRQARFVFVVDAQGQARQHAVELGAGRGEWIEIIGALKPGAAVVVRGAERLQDGQRVNVIRDLAAERAAAQAG